MLRAYLVATLCFASFTLLAQNNPALVAKVAAREKLLLETTLFYFPDGHLPDDAFDARLAEMTVLWRLGEFVDECLSEKLLSPSSPISEWRPVRVLWTKVFHTLASETLKELADGHDRLERLGLIKSDSPWSSSAPFTKRAVLGEVLNGCSGNLQH